MEISALVPTYNRRRYVARAIQSILAQSVLVDEIIVIDDGSTDGTAEEIERQFGSSVRIIRQANQGVAAARRRGILEAGGEWIAFLDSDDEWTTDRNRIFLQAIRKVPSEVAWIFGNTQDVTDAGDGSTQYQKHGLSIINDIQVFKDSLSLQYPIQFGLLQSSVIKREALLELKCFSENLKYTEDRLAGFQVACHYNFAAIPEVVTNLYRTSDLSSSSLAFAMNALENSSLRAEYHRAAIECFCLAARTVRRQPWGELHAESVRGLCKELATRGESSRQLSLRQFRYGVSCKSLAFFCVAVTGAAGVNLWSKAASIKRSVSAPSSRVQVPSEVSHK